MVGSFILGVVVALLMHWLSREFFKEEREFALKREVVSGTIAACINYIAIKAPASLAVLCIPIVIAGMVYLFLWWQEEGNTIKEALVFLGINLVLAIILNNVAVRVRDLTNLKWLVASSEALGVVSLVLLIGFLIADLVWFRDEVEHKLAKIEKKMKEGQSDDDDEFREKHQHATAEA